MTSVTTTNTFADHYANLVDDGMNSNRAVARVNGAIDTTMTSSTKYVECWIDPMDVVIVRLMNGDIALLHRV
jgi:hypothetical protein